MTLSSGSRQHRKSMLPTPRLSSRVSSRRAVLGDTSRIARRVPSPLQATSSNTGPTTQARILRPAGNCNPEFYSRRAGSPSKIPWPLASGQTPSPTPEQSETSSPIGTPLSEVKRIDAQSQYPTPPAPTETKNERIKGQEGHHQGTETRHSAQLVPLRPRPRSAETALGSFSRVENGSSMDSGPPALTRKKSALTSSVSGKENQRPPTRTRVPAPTAAPVGTITVRPIRRTPAPAATPSSTLSRGTSPRPLAIRKLTSPAAPCSPQGHSHFRSPPRAPVVVPAGIKVLMEDIGRFAEEWTEMFDDLASGADRRDDDAATPTFKHPIEGATTFCAHTSAAGKQIQNLFLPVTSGSTASVRRKITTSALEDGEMNLFDVTPASLARWQHRDNAIVKGRPVEDKTERDTQEVVSAYASDPPTAGALHRAVPQNPSLPMTPQAARYLSPLPEINQSPIISGSHLVEMTSFTLSNRKDKLPLMTPHGIDAVRRNGSTPQARCYPPAALPSLSSSPLSTIVSLSPMSMSKPSSPWVNLRGHEFGSQRTAHAERDRMPTRSSSLRGLRAIFKRTSAGLTGGQRQRAESLKERISEPRVLSLGSISISNLRDAGVSNGCAQSERAQESMETVGGT